MRGEALAIPSFPISRKAEPSRSAGKVRASFDLAQDRLSAYVGMSGTIGMDGAMIESCMRLLFTIRAVAVQDAGEELPGIGFR
jgi:hypothetical protein